MSDEEYQWHWWEAAKELKLMERRLQAARRMMLALEVEMLYRGVRVPKSKPKWRPPGVGEDVPY